MAYSQQTSMPRRVLGFSAITLFHLGLIYLLLSGLGRQVVDIVAAPLMARIIVPKPPPPPPPPPRPQAVKHAVNVAPPPPFVPPSEVMVSPLPAPSAIQVTTAVKPTHVVKPTPAPPAPVIPDTDVSEQAISGLPLQYPPTMVDFGVEGSADIACNVDTDGRTSNCKVLTTTGDASFGNAALKHAIAAHFRPATHNGTLVASRHRWHVVFKLSE